MIRISATVAGAMLLSSWIHGVPAQDPEPPNKDKAPTKKKPAPAKEDVVRLKGNLTDQDPFDKIRPDHHYKIHPYKMAPGKTYVITMVDENAARGTMDPYLRLEDSAGKTLMENDDITMGVNRDARIIFTPVKEDTFKIVATTCFPKSVGNYSILIQAVPAGQAVAAIGAGLSLQTPVKVGDLTITSLHPWGAKGNTGGGNLDTHGYIEYRFLIENNSETQGHSVKLTLPRSQGGFRYGRYLESLHKTLDIGPGATAEVSLFQPDLVLVGGHDLRVEIDGRPEEQGVPVPLLSQRGTRFSSFFYGGGGSRRSVVTVLVPAGETTIKLQNNVFKSAVGAPPRPTPSGGGSRSGSYTEPGPHHGKGYTYWDLHYFDATPAPLDWWSPHWLGYTSYEGVALPGELLKDAPHKVRDALWQYVECGGTLLVLGSAKVPESWERVREETADFVTYYPGFGHCLVAKKDVTRWVPEDWRVVTAMWERTLPTWNQITTPTDANRDFPIVENLTVPVRGLFIAMIVFVLLIGPLNFYWLSQTKRRIWLLWTVPAFSLVTCVFLIGYMIATEGWHGHVRAEGITVLDESAQRGATIGTFGCYSPMTAAGGLRFSLDTELTPHVRTDRSSYSVARHPYVVDWTSDQHLTEGWIVAKVPIHFLTRRGEKRLERLGVHKNDDGALAIVNSLGADISSISLAGADGKIHTASDVRAGAEAKLQPTDRQAANKLPRLSEAFTRPWVRLPDEIAETPAEYLRPGCYIAVLEDGPFLEQGLRQTQSRRTRSVVYGIMKELP